MSTQDYLGVQVTTTASLEGWKVEGYVGPVSVHLVAGTSLFSDFFASLSDLFGGRSGSYGGELARLYTEAAEALARKSKSLGANAILGLRIDFDEISGQNKSMFMLNAVGTAVRVRREAAPGEIAATHGQAHLPAAEMAVQVKKTALLRELESGVVQLSPDTWLFAMEHRMAEFGGAALGSLVGAMYDDQTRQATERSAAQFFSAIDPEDAKPWLYRGLVREKGDGSDATVRSFCLRMINALNLLDFDRAAGLLRGSHRERIQGLRIVYAHPQSYGPDELERLQALEEQIRAAFPARWRKVRKSGLFGERDVWQCPCGKYPDLDDTHCSNCMTDTFGLQSTDPRPEQALAELAARIAVLRGNFAPAEQPAV